MTIERRYRLGPCELRIEAKTKRCLYHYEAGEDAEFQFDLLSEVGELFQPYFLNIIREQRLTIETVEVKEKPWIYDRMKGD